MGSGWGSTLRVKLTDEGNVGGEGGLERQRDEAALFVKPFGK